MGRRQVQWVWGLKGRRVTARSSSHYVECEIQWLAETYLHEPLSATTLTGSLPQRGRNTTMTIQRLFLNFDTSRPILAT